MGVRLEGDEEVLARLAAEFAKMKKNQLQAMHEIGAHLHEKAFENTPFKTGALRNSIYFVAVQVGNVIIGELGADTPYAYVQHEREDYEHEVGKAGYLTKTITEEEPVLIQIIYKWMKL